MKNDTRFETLYKFPAFRMQLSLHELLSPIDKNQSQTILENIKKDIEDAHALDFVSLKYINKSDNNTAFFELPDEVAQDFENIIELQTKEKRGTLAVAESRTMIRIFIGAAAQDANHVETLKKHLKLYERQNLIEIWDRMMIPTGELILESIEQELHTADIILLLFSADLLAEDFIWGAEMNRILGKVKRREVQLIPILLSPSGFVDTPFAAYAAVPQRDKPISSYANKDEAWAIIVEYIKGVLFNKDLNSDFENVEESKNTIDIEILLKEVNELIAKAKTSVAVDIIIEWLTRHEQVQLKNDALFLKARLEKFKREEMLGMLSFSEVAQEMARINNSLFSIVKNLDNSVPFLPDINQMTEARKILILTANPAGTTKFNFDKEFVRIYESINRTDEKFQITVKRGIDRSEFLHLIELEKPEILHFTGHGTSEGLILNNADKNDIDILNYNAINLMFKYMSEQKMSLKIVLFMAVFSEEFIEAISKNVQYFVGLTIVVSDEIVISFSSGFYTKLSKFSDFEDCFRAGLSHAALAGAKNSDFVMYKNGNKLII
jgi:hypothetical protein